MFVLNPRPWSQLVTTTSRTRPSQDLSYTHYSNPSNNLPPSTDDSSTTKDLPSAPRVTVYPSGHEPK